MSRERLRAQLMQDEGLRLKPYTDTVGKLTIGYGRNLSDRGLRLSEALVLLDNDLEEAIRECAKSFPWLTALDSARQAVIVNMAFNLGLPKLQKFVKTLAAVERGDYQTAADAMLASTWARQVGARAQRLAAQMATGTWTPPETN